MNKPHQKHAKLSRPAGGDWGRAELAIHGAPCSVISDMVLRATTGCRAERKIGYVDASHSQEAESPALAVHITDRPGSLQLVLKSPMDHFRQRYLLNDCDLVLVNGNHFRAQRQIVVIHPGKSLHSKLEALTDVQLVLLAEASIVPDYLLSLTEGVPVLPLDDTAGLVDFLEQYLQRQQPALNGLVLAGGQSLRMGRDKGQLQYHGKPQRDHAFDLLQPLCREVYISCNAAQRDGIDSPFIEDRFLGVGPMGGILSALQFSPDHAWLTVACDLPHLSAKSLEYLIARREPSRLATAFMHAVEGFPEPLLTIWEPRAYPVLLQALAAGVSCPRKVLMNSDVALLHAPDSMELQNVNDPDACRAAQDSITHSNSVHSL